MQAAGAILILLLISLILFTGRRPIPIKNKKNNAIVQPESDFGDIELPPPVHSEESVTETRETKIQRTRGRSRASESKEGAIPQPLPQPSHQMTVEMPQTTISEDDVESEGTARVHVVKSDPEIQAEAEVDQYLAQQRERRVVFRDRINRERRLEMSKRLVQKVRKWAESEDGEDLSTLTTIPGHGLAVLYEPEDPNPSIPQGISYVRIDDERVLKVRVSLDVPRLEAATDEEIEGFKGGPPLPIDIENGIPVPPTLPELPPPIVPDE